MKRFITTVAALALLGTAVFADAKGDEIARKHFALKKASDTQAHAVMTLIDKSGTKKTRSLDLFTRRLPRARIRTSASSTLPTLPGPNS